MKRFKDGKINNGRKMESITYRKLDIIMGQLGSLGPKVTRLPFSVM